MKIKYLLDGVNVKRIIGDRFLEVKQLNFDSRRIDTGGLFFALSGSENDGHDYARYAEKNGAAAIVCEHEVPVSVTQIIVDNAREAMSEIASNFYGKPQQKLKIIGVTGTNGKTTTTFIIKSILEQGGYTVGLIGTSGCYIKDRYLPTMLTTPDPIELFKLLKIMADENTDFAILEVSAHALALKKIAPIMFETAVFTNISLDHLDFFKTMDNYINAKKMLFSPEMCKTAAINADDTMGKMLLGNPQVMAVSYGIENDADIYAKNADTSGKLCFCLNINGNTLIETKLYGKFNLYNCLAAAAACVSLGIETRHIVKGIEKMSVVMGRFNVLDFDKFKFVIDYAHTPDGIQNVLSSARQICGGRLICVFGCGGNRDKSKRQIMGSVASELADYCVITSDNPRFEDPMQIIKEIEKGICNKNYIIIENRKKAINYAAFTAKEGDIIAVLGKGGEQYQEISGIKYPYSDFDAVNNIMAAIIHNK